ncbi:MAG: YebC/PmpR family DNA-binding transcriptional regulator, partial [Gammaproteobacteria bacterium]|nr:YebC/PmpR family DNA-binding transcriptional regulator [Gammaproteobacteria bacterium]
VERAIKRGTGELEGVAYEEVRYEGYAPGGAAVLVECATDNRKRTVSEVRHAFTKHGGNLGTDGSVAYLFNQFGVLAFVNGADEDRIMDVAVGAGAEDIQSDDHGGVEVITSPERFTAVRDALIEAGLTPDEAEITQRAMSDVPIAGADAEKVLTLLNALEELDDVQNVYSNADFPAELLQQDAG